MDVRLELCYGCIVTKREAICGLARSPFDSFSKHPNFPFILLSAFCPRINDKLWISLDRMGSLLLTHTKGWNGLFGLFEGGFQGRVNSGVLAFNAWEGRTTYSLWREKQKCLGSYKKDDWGAVWADRRREENELVAFLASSGTVKCSHVSICVNIHVLQCYASTAETLSSIYICTFRK